MGGRERRDRGREAVSQATNPLWKMAYGGLTADWFLSLPVGTVFNGEDLRLNALAKGLPEPHHPNAWSAEAASYLAAVMRIGWAEEIGASATKDDQSHARLCRDYRRIK